MSATELAPLVAPAHPEGMQEEFFDHATKTDSTGFPLEGKFGISFSCPIDISQVAAEKGCGEEMCTAINRVMKESNPSNSERSCQQRSRILYRAYKGLKPGTIVGLKSGFTLLAYMEITEGYHYVGHEAWGKHRWGYRILRKATREESAVVEVRHPIMTYYDNFITLPADIKQLSLVRKAEARLDYARTREYERKKAVDAMRAELARLEELEKDAAAEVGAAQRDMELITVL